MKTPLINVINFKPIHPFNASLLRGIALLLSMGLAWPAWGELRTNNDGTVTDSTTKLTWDQCAYGLSGTSCATGSAAAATWTEALAVAQAANTSKHKGFADWRLPNKNELASIARVRAFPVIDPTYFPGAPEEPFWTSTNFKTPNSAWTVNFFDNSINYLLKTNRFRVRLVRDIPSVAVPVAPTNVSATPKDQSITLTFTAPTNAPVEKYQATCGTIKGDTGAATPPPTTITVSGLSNGTEYTCTVAALNGGGRSPESAPSNAVKPASVPSCTLTATPVVIASGSSATLKVSCTPSDTTATLTATDLTTQKTITPAPTVILTADNGKNTATGTTNVSPAVPTQYSVVGTNSKGSGAAVTAGVYVCNTSPYQDFPGLSFTGTANSEYIFDSVVNTVNLGSSGVGSGVGSDVIDGGAGIDVVRYNCNRDNFFVIRDSKNNRWSVSSKAEGADLLTNVEWLQFSDEPLVLDLTGNAGKAYRIYRAAFARTPDVGVLVYWLGKMNGGTSLEDVAAGFVDSAEFKTLYGTSPSNTAFVTKLYNNVLGREPEQDGLKYWVGEMDNNGKSKKAVLAAFSESPENLANVLNNVLYGKPYPTFGALPAPTGLAATATGLTINLSWQAVSGATTYKFYRNGGSAPLATVTGTSYSDTVTAAGTYTYTVAACDASGNCSAQSTPASATTTSDASAPSMPTGLKVDATTSDSVTLSWNAATTSEGVTYYMLTRKEGNTTKLFYSNVASYVNKEVSPATSYTYTVKACNAKDICSAESEKVSGSTK
ncbi:MAG: DUF1566 domain-containing protein [Rhodoferax sp.]|nr:DUF1566 domain-containing protein [Rhodoferax sp.]